MTDNNEQPTTSSPAETQPPVDNMIVSGNETHAENSSLQGEPNVVSENREAKNEQGILSGETSAQDSSAEHSVNPLNPTPDTPDPDSVPKQDIKTDTPPSVQKLPAIDGDEAEGTGSVDFGNTTNDLQKEAIRAMAMKAEKDRVERETEPVHAEQMLFDNNMILRLDVVESNQPILLEVTGDLIVGRADNVTDYMPEIDLTPHGAYRFGLSRRHALIRRHEGSLLVKDLSSRNGTFVNGEQVKAGETHPLNDGDELRFGNLALRVNFQRKQ